MAPEQMACRKPIDENRGLLEGGRVQTGRSGLQLKGRLVCLVVLPKQSHNTAVQVAAEGEGVCL